MTKILTIAKREFFQTVKKKSFWISTLVFPIFMGIIIFVSGASSTQADELFKPVDKLGPNQSILIKDDTNILVKEIFVNGFKQIENIHDGIELVKNDTNVLVFIHYPKDLITNKDSSIKIYLQNRSLLENGKYNATAQALLKNSVLSTLTQDQIQIIATEMPVNVTAYQNGEEVKMNVGTFIVPGFAVFIYFLLVSFGTSYLLSSVAEEKESRMIEILLSTVKPIELIAGKLIGLLGVVLTQVTLLVIFFASIILVTKAKLPFEIGQIEFEPFQVITAILFVTLGFALIACIMIGVGASVPTLKEAQSFSSIFIILSIFPLYFITAIVTNPNGTLAKITSFTPLTSPIVILFRNALNSLTPSEVIIAFVVLIIEVCIAFFISLKLFRLGSLEYSNKVSLRHIFR